MDLFDLFAKIELDTSDYESGIATVESGAGDAESAIGGIGSASDNADGQLDNLGSQASNTGGDLDNLGGDADNAGSDIDSMGGEASGAAGDLDSLQSMASSASGMLDSLGGSAGGASGELGSLGDEMSGDLTAGGDSASTSLGDVSDLLGAFATGGLVAGAVAAVGEVSTAFYDLALEAENSRVTIAQGTGATGEDLEQLEVNAQNALGGVKLASQTNLGDVSNTLAELNTRFGLTDEELETTTSTMTDFAHVTGQDGVQAVDSIADVMSYWGLEMDDMPGLLDNITTASQGTKMSAGELENALYKNAGQFDSLGYSVDDAIAFLATYAANGGEVSDVTTMLKNAIKNLSDTTDDVPGAFQAAIDAISECDSVSEALNAQVGDTGLTVEDVFGSKAAQNLAQNVLTGQTSIEDWTSALEDNQGALEQTIEDSETMQDSISGSMQRIKSDVSKIFTPAVETVVGGAADMLDGVVSFAEDTGTKLSEWNENATEWLYNQFGTTTEGAIESVHNLADTIDEKFEAAGETIQGWGESVGEKLGSLKDDVGSFATEFGEKATEAASTFIDNIGSGISGGIETVKGKAQELGESVSGKIKSFFGIGGEGDMEEVGEEVDQGFANGVENGGEKAADAMEEESEGVLSRVKNFFGINSPSTVMEEQGEYMTEGMVQGFDELADEVTAKFQEMADMIWKWSGEQITTMQQTGIILEHAFVTGMEDMPTDVQADVLDTVIKNIEDWSSTLEKTADSTAKSFNDSIISGTKSLPSDFSKMLDEISSSTNKWSDNLIKKASDTASKFLKNVTNGIKSLPSDVKNTLDSVMSNVTTWGNDIENSAQFTANNVLKNFISGISSLPNDTNSILNDTESLFDSFASSVSSIMNTAGIEAINGFTNGISDMPYEASSVMYNVESAMTNVDMYNTMYNIGSNAMIGFNNGMVSQEQLIYNNANIIANNVRNTISSALRISSPSRVTKYLGEMTGEGFAEGIIESTSDVEDATDSLIDAAEMSAVDMEPAYMNVSGSTGKTGGSSIGIMTSLEKKLDEMTDLLDKSFSEIKNMKIYLNTGVLAGGVTAGVDRNMSRMNMVGARNG